MSILDLNGSNGDDPERVLPLHGRAVGPGGQCQSVEATVRPSRSMPAATGDPPRRRSSRPPRTRAHSTDRGVTEDDNGKFRPRCSMPVPMATRSRPVRLSNSSAPRSPMVSRAAEAGQHAHRPPPGALVPDLRYQRERRSDRRWQVYLYDPAHQSRRRDRSMSPGMPITILTAHACRAGPFRLARAAIPAWPRTSDAVTQIT